MDIRRFFKSSASGGKKLTPVAPETPATTTEGGGALASSTSHDPSYVFSGASQSGEHVVTVGPSRPVELLTDSVCDLGTDEPQQYSLKWRVRGPLGQRCAHRGRGSPSRSYAAELQVQLT
ncbi:unnamed protein product [Leuciscus chuanchicus]